eukprot:TRINITY_DN9615_c0_g2_i5.p1 TRINITY_DN9615_c0_g2~~TRINITY_DN9615_c0_g2_i5.p1  ORF type:complete len:391 (-),score=42.56 TRINITY_DN9615_c0_g2_i5:294-1385(-)
MASGVGYTLMKPGPICRSTNCGSDIWLVSSWRSSDVAGFRLADQPEKRRVARLRLRASGSQIQDAPPCCNERKPGRLSRRSVLGVGAISIQPMLAWSSTADTQKLNESQNIFQAFLESVRRLKRKVAVAPTPPPASTLEEAAVTPSSSETDPGAQPATEPASPSSPDSAVESATESPAESFETAAEVRDPVPETFDSASVGASEAGDNLEPAESAASEAGDNLEPAESAASEAGDNLDPAESAADVSASVGPAEGLTPGISAPEGDAPREEPVSASVGPAEGLTPGISAPEGDAPREQPVSASPKSGEESKAAASSDGEEFVSSEVETPTVAAPGESPAAGSSESVVADSETPTPTEVLVEGS